tara:strand:- start:2123 stop:2470 length:348 start_codon:yes stop_codon:yes gene_type:complete
MTVEAIKANNLNTMREVTKALKDEQRTPKRPTKTKEVPAAELLEEVGIEVQSVPMAKVVKATSAKFTGKESKLACSLRLIETYKVRDEFVKMLQGHFPELTEFNARCYFNKVRQG